MIRAMLLFVLILIALAVRPGLAHENEVSISVSGDQRCITSNGTPNHDIGQFPTRGNPNSFSEQNIRVCVDATPGISGRVTEDTSASGISLTGIYFRPATAEYYDPTGRGGFSRNPASGWKVEGMGAAHLLGMDAANAHVDHCGLYHYHAPSDPFTGSLEGTLVGYAADGFDIHYAGSSVVSSWQLKSGTRPSGPGGVYDGTYVEDWEYVAGSGNLDECNGAMVNEKYVYFATDTFPFFPRCFKGNVSSDFTGRP